MFIGPPLLLASFDLSYNIFWLDSAQALFETRSPYPIIQSGSDFGATRVTEGEDLSLDCHVSKLDISKVDGEGISWWCKNETNHETRIWGHSFKWNWSGKRVGRDEEGKPMWIDGRLIGRDVVMKDPVVDTFVYTSTLMIKNVNAADGGKYFCMYKMQKSKHGLRVTVKQRVNCEWSEWGDWSACSQTCDDGWRIRHRSVEQLAQNGGEKCTGDDVEQEDCGIVNCPSKQIMITSFAVC